MNDHPNVIIIRFPMRRLVSILVLEVAKNVLGKGTYGGYGIRNYNYFSSRGTYK